MLVKLKRWWRMFLFGLFKIPLPPDPEEFELNRRSVQYVNFIDLKAGTHIKKELKK